MSSLELLILSSAPNAGAVLPALSLLPHTAHLGAPEVSGLLERRSYDAILVDGTQDLVAARRLCGLLASADVDAPVVAVIGEGGLVALSAEWGVAEILLPTAGPAEVDARLRLLHGRTEQQAQSEGEVLTFGELVIEEATYTARLRNKPMELTYKEFELLKYLAQHAGRVFTRSQLLQEVWGYDFFGGARTVDVHVRRLRAKLGPEHDQLIGTVRNVGYKFVRPGTTSQPQPESRTESRPERRMVRFGTDGSDPAPESNVAELLGRSIQRSGR
ncbi:winged helix-turn-helix transcriptional regulator [Actinoalloteichus hymeniacidonis]|uniref:Transcriptional regulatory protein GlnR n=1 Tax=Actinoalloteichus hymeniacidonis TaxID=340345 RepID=A0AAC9HVK2_9PSEU|nr:response regulator transcription factor [Actinoalloteichus hymeniacidonis]AOS65951.1 Transcriptional regulatory protein GlnR [Actinoalloteichus hymeniacidonis]MBB5905953.1 DNA-binding response OmpR family regulator [Actinoalloteichus hymeniacidonis]